jgi:hypothetical protein
MKHMKHMRHNENISAKKTPKQTPTSVGGKNMQKKTKKTCYFPLFFSWALGQWENLHLVLN